MAKAKTAFFCNECGYEASGWLGRCPGCGAWNTLVEEKKVSGSAVTPPSRGSWVAGAGGSHLGSDPSLSL